MVNLRIHTQMIHGIGIALLACMLLLVYIIATSNASASQRAVRAGKFVVPQVLTNP